MNCQTCQETIVDALYGELDAAALEAFEAALERCPDCAAETAALRQTMSAFDRLEAIELPAAKRADIVRAARIAAAEPRSRWHWLTAQPWFGVVLSTAVVLVGIAAFYQLVFTTDEGGGSSVGSGATVATIEPPSIDTVASRRGEVGAEEQIEPEGYGAPAALPVEEGEEASAASEAETAVSANREALGTRRQSESSGASGLGEEAVSPRLERGSGRGGGEGSVATTTRGLGASAGTDAPSRPTDRAGQSPRLEETARRRTADELQSPMPLADQAPSPAPRPTAAAAPRAAPIASRDDDRPAVESDAAPRGPRLQMGGTLSTGSPAPAINAGPPPAEPPTRTQAVADSRESAEAADADPGPLAVAMAHIGAGEDRRAVRVLERALRDLRFSPDQRGEALWQLGSARQRLGDASAARAAFSRLSTELPNHPRARAARAALDALDGGRAPATSSPGPTLE